MLRFSKGRVLRGLVLLMGLDCIKKLCRQNVICVCVWFLVWIRLKMEFFVNIDFSRSLCLLLFDYIITQFPPDKV